MRRTLIAAIVVLTALAVAPSHAETELAGCRRTAGPNGVPGNVSVGGVCLATVPVTETIVVTIRLTPSAGFTGWLTAKVTSGQLGGTPVSGLYVAGELVNGMDHMVTTLVAAPDSDWKLTVSAGDPSRMGTYLFPPLPQQVVLPGVAVGEFGADVILGGTEPAV